MRILFIGDIIGRPGREVVGRELPGLGERKAQSIASAWGERRALTDLMTFLQNASLPVALAARILKKYGTAAESIVKHQPYRIQASFSD